MEIPGKIRIGGQDIDVCIVERIEGDKLGQICVAEGKMLIADNFSTSKQSESSKVNTFIHEVVHGILDTMGETELSQNEKFVLIFSSFMVDVIEEIIRTNNTKDYDKSE